MMDARVASTEPSVTAFTAFVLKKLILEQANATNLLDLPTQLHDRIAKYLPTSALQSLATTAKAFSKIAQTCLCRHIHIELRGNRYEYCLQKLIVTLLVRKDLATSVQTVSIAQKRRIAYSGMPIRMIRRCKAPFEILKAFSTVDGMEVALATLVLLSPQLHTFDISLRPRAIRVLAFPP